MNITTRFAQSRICFHFARREICKSRISQLACRSHDLVSIRLKDEWDTRLLIWVGQRNMQVGHLGRLLPVSLLCKVKHFISKKTSICCSALTSQLLISNKLNLSLFNVLECTKGQNICFVIYTTVILFWQGSETGNSKKQVREAGRSLISGMSKLGRRMM